MLDKASCTMLQDKVVSHSPVFRGKGGSLAKYFMEQALRIMSSSTVVKPEKFKLTVSHSWQV